MSDLVVSRSLATMNNSDPSTLPLTTDHVRAALKALNLEIEIRTFDESTATAPEAAAAIGTALGSIVKSLCFMVDDQPVLVLTAGDQRVDDRKLGALYGVARKKVKIADAETAITVTGYAPGGVPPVGHRTRIPLLVDRTLQRFETVFAAAGSPNTIFPIALDILIEATNAQIADLTREPGGAQADD
jgi:Cys-tRNA(Pro) deacylase